MVRKMVMALGLVLQCCVVFASDVIESDRLVGFGEAKYPVGFKHFDFVNPNAPKGGKVTYAQIGTYDSFNRYASRGIPRQQVASSTTPYFTHRQMNWTPPTL